MMWVPLVFFLGTFVSGSSSQLVVTQSPSMAKAVGSTVMIPCALSSGYSISSKRVNWVQQKSGGAPVFLYHYFKSSDQGRGSGIPERFTVSPDTSNNLWNLVITGVQDDDDADYYCLAWDDKLRSYIFGGGTHLSILGGPSSPPTVHVYPPSPEEKESKNKATLVCLVTDFSPPSLTVNWEADGTAVSSSVETTRPTKVNDKYVVSSYLTVTPSDWEKHQSYTCKVTHEGSNYVKSVSHSQCP